jgi:hypothetical protein
MKVGPGAGGVVESCTKIKRYNTFNCRRLMTTANPAGAFPTDSAITERATPRRLTTETKASFKTSEFFAYLAAVAGVLLASQLVGTEDGHADYFRADQAWLYVVVLTVGYMISRGLAKAGSRDPYDAE